MGLDPLTMGLIASAGVQAAGQFFGQKSQNKQQKTVNQTAEGMMQSGVSPYQAQADALFSGLSSFDPNQGQIDIGSIISGMNTGNDALNQFLRSDPMRQLGIAAGGSFDASSAFNMLQANDDLQIGRAADANLARFPGLGQRFGGSAMATQGRMRSDYAAQIAARNAGIAQSSFENAANRQLQAASTGLGLQFQGAQALGSQGNAQAQIMAQIAMANQGNLSQNSQMNWLQKLQALQTGNSLGQQQFGNNRDLLAIMAGLQPGSNLGAGATALGNAGMDISQLLMLLPLMQGKGKA